MKRRNDANNILCTKSIFVLFNYTEEDKGITINKIEDKLHEMFGEKSLQEM